MMELTDGFNFIFLLSIYYLKTLVFNNLKKNKLEHINEYYSKLVILFALIKVFKNFLLNLFNNFFTMVLSK